MRHPEVLTHVVKDSTHESGCLPGGIAISAWRCKILSVLF